MKRISVFVLGSIALLLLIALLVFTARTRYPGGFTISCETLSQGESLSLHAVTPFGRLEQYNIPPEGFLLSGFYRSAEIECSKLTDSVEIWVNYKSEFYKYVVIPDADSGSLLFAVPIEESYSISFFKKLLLVIVWLFTVPLIQHVLIALLALGVFVVLLLWFMAMRRRARTSKSRGEHVAINHLLIFLSGLLFWIFVSVLLIEISLRIFGSFYSSIDSSTPNPNADYAYTILCLGDSFTYGIGAAPNQSYPAQLQHIIEKQTGLKARVINAGICAGNTTQMLEQVQGLLNQYRPDAVVMLFGMANSWNYYGFTRADSFLYRIKTYKLIQRIRHNLAYRKHGFEMFSRVDDFSRRILIRALKQSPNQTSGFDFLYYAGSYHLSKRNWPVAYTYFSEASSIFGFNDSVRNALWVCTEKTDAGFYFVEKQAKSIGHTVVPETVHLLDSLISQHPEAVDLQIVKYRYLWVKGDTASCNTLLGNLMRKYPQQETLIIDLVHMFDINKADSIINQLPESHATHIAKALLALNEEELVAATHLFESAVALYPESPAALLAVALLRKTSIPQSNTDTLPKHIGELLTTLQPIIDYLNYGILNNYTIEEMNQFLLYMGIDSSLLTNIDTATIDEDVSVLLLSAVFTRFNSLIEETHENFFLIHRNKRSMDLKDAEVFAWIENDINTIVDICLKQHYRVICMNYPIIPPPVSEEMLYWAAQTGEIWRRTASKKGISFIDNDSIFDLYGEQKHSLFEPAFTGSEHCNEKRI